MEKESKNGLFMFVTKKVILTYQCQKRNDFKVMDFVYFDSHKCVVTFTKFIIYVDFRNKKIQLNCRQSLGNYEAISRLLIPLKIGLQLIEKSIDRDKNQPNRTGRYVSPFTFTYSEYDQNFVLKHKQIDSTTILFRKFELQQLSSLSDLMYFSQHKSKQKAKCLNQLLHGKFQRIYYQQYIKIDDFSKYLTIQNKMVSVHDNQLENSQLYTVKYNDIQELINFNSCIFITNTQGITIKMIENENSLFYFDLINYTTKQLGIYFPNSQMVYFGKQDKEKSIIILTVHKKKQINILFYDYLKNLIIGQIVNYWSFFTPVIHQKKYGIRQKYRIIKRLDISININRRISQDFSCIFDIQHCQSSCQLIYHKKVSQNNIIMHLCKKTKIYEKYGNQIMIRLIRLMI